MQMFLQNTCTNTSGGAKPETCSFPSRQMKVILQSEEGCTFIIFFSVIPGQPITPKTLNRFQSGQNTVVQGIQDALNSSVSFKHAVSICSIEFIRFSNYCMQSWAELASSSETENLVNFLQSQRNPNSTWNVGGTLRLPGS